MEKIIDFETIKKILPHDFPYYMLDFIIELEAKKRVVGIKNITGNELWFLGHFKDQAILPEMMIIEAMAQTGAFLFYNKHRIFRLNFILGKIKEVKFFKAIVPGDQMIIEVRALRITKNNAYIRSKVFVKKTIVSEAEMIFLRDKSNNRNL